MTAEVAQMTQASDPLINLELETVLLGALLVENRLIDSSADRLSADDFYEPVHQRIFEVIVREHALGRTVSPVTIRGFFQDDEGMEALGGVNYLIRLTADYSGLLGPGEFTRQIADLSRRRKIRAGMIEASRSCADLDVPIAEITSLADDALSASDRGTIAQPSGGEAIDNLLKSYGEEVKGTLCGCIPSIDGLIGQMRPKQLIIGAGRPGMGKTTAALSYGIGAARKGHGVLFVSLEMSAIELAAKMVSDMCYADGKGVPFHAIRDGKLNDWQMRRACEAGSEMHRLPFRIVDVGSLTTGRLNMIIRRNARRMEAEGHRLELVIVDYLQLLSTDVRLKSNYETVSEVSRSLKAAAKDHGVAILALAQLSREVEKRFDKRPQLSDLRDSGQIEQDADVVLFLLRQEYYHRAAEPDQMSPEWDEWNRLLNKMAGEIEFICAKRRNGTTGSAKGQFLGAYQAVRG